MMYEFIMDNIVLVWCDAMLQHPLMAMIMWLMILLVAIFYLG